MELSKGVCFFCSNTKIITNSTDIVLSKLKSFLNNSAIDQEQLNEIKPLEVCPICYHKINLLVTLNKNIAADKNDTYSCTFCGSLDEVIKVAKWDTFDKISSDFPVLTSNISTVCPACLFFLDTRNVMKEKLISVYPYLKIDHQIPKFDDNIKSHSTPIRKKRQKISKSKPKSISKSHTLDMEKSSLNLSSIKIKPLSKQIADFRLVKTVNGDYKFMNQILIIKLQRLNGSLEKAAEFVKLENVTISGTNVRRTRNSGQSEDNENSKVIKESEVNNEQKDSKDIKESEVKNEPKESEQCKDLKEIENTKESEVEKDGKEGKQFSENESKDNKTAIKDKSKPNEMRKKTSKIQEISSESEQETKIDVKKKQFFKIKLNKKSKKTAKKVVEKEQKMKQKLTEFKMELLIKLEKIKMPEKNIMDEDRVEETNVLESEDSIDLELKDEDVLSPEKMIETEAATVSDDGDEKMDTSGGDKMETSGGDKMETSCNDTQSSEENNAAVENLNTSVEEELAKEKNTAEEMYEIVAPSQDAVDEGKPKEKTAVGNKEENSDSEAAEKSEIEETGDKSEESNFDSEETEKNESEETENKNEEPNYDSEVTEKNESDLDAAETDGNDEYVTKDDIEIDDGGAPSKSKKVIEQNGKDAKNGDNDLRKEDDNEPQEDGNETQEDDNETQEDDDETQEDDNETQEVNETQEDNNETQEDDSVTQENDKDAQENEKVTQEGNSLSQEESTDNLVSSIEANEQYISEIESALEGFDSCSELDKEDQLHSVVTLDSSQDEIVEEAGKRKRSESVSDANEPEKKKKKVTFSEDVVSDD